MKRDNTDMKGQGHLVYLLALDNTYYTKKVHSESTDLHSRPCHTSCDVNVSEKTNYGLIALLAIAVVYKN